jgi:hypothetical protein
VRLRQAIEGQPVDVEVALDSRLNIHTRALAFGVSDPPFALDLLWQLAPAHGRIKFAQIGLVVWPFARRHTGEGTGASTPVRRQWPLQAAAAEDLAG